MQIWLQNISQEKTLIKSNVVKAPKIIRLILLICLVVPMNLTGQNISFYEDQKSSWDIHNAIESQAFTPTENHFIQSDITASTFWIKITPKKSFKATDRILFSNSVNHYKTIYFHSEDNQIEVYTFGANQINQSATLLPSFILNKNIKAIYISIASDSFIFENFQILNEVKANKNITIFIITQTLYFCIVFLTFIYIAFAFFKSKRSVLGYYLVYLFGLLFMFFYASNIGGYLVWELLPFSSSYLESFGTTLLVTSYLLLAATIVQVKYYSKILFYLTKAVAVFSVIIVALLWIFAESVSISTFANIYPGIGLLLILTFTILGIIKKNKNSYLLFIGIMAVFSSGLLKLSINWGVMNYSIFLDFIIYLGFLIEVFIFTYLVLRHVEKEVVLTQEQRQKLAQNASEINELHLQLARLTDESKNQENNIGFKISPNINELLHTPLTPREMDVLIELAKGGNYDVVAERLFISKATLKTHIAKIYVKLDTKNRIDAINEALKLTAQLNNL
jgi:DNA-binding CsgD family transcriptional regulator